MSSKPRVRSVPQYLAALLRRAAACMLALSALPASPAEAALDIAYMYSSPVHRDNFLRAINRYRESGQAVSARVLEDSRYRASIFDWLKSSKAPDVLYWQAGDRLRDLARQGLIRPVDGLWRANGWDTLVPKGIKAAVSVDGTPYALPYSLYVWGVLYKPALFARLRLQPPQNWTELLASCRILRQQKIAPFVISMQDKWSAGAWFDYLDMRINGLAFHQQLAQGKVAYTDTRVRVVFEHWKQLIDNQCLSIEPHARQPNILPFLHHEVAAMALVGSVTGAMIPVQQKDSFRMFSFPLIRKGIGRAEDVPIDVLILPTHAPRHQRKQAEKLLTWLGRPEVQSDLNLHTGALAVTASPSSPVTPLEGDVVHIGSQSDGCFGFYDREVTPKMDRKATELLFGFLTSPDVETIMGKLEALRREHYGAVPAGTRAEARPPRIDQAACMKASSVLPRISASKPP